MKPEPHPLGELQLDLLPTEADPNVTQEGDRFFHPSIYPVTLADQLFLEFSNLSASRGKGGDRLPFLPEMPLLAQGKWLLQVAVNLGRDAWTLCPCTEPLLLEL